MIDVAPKLKYILAAVLMVGVIMLESTPVSASIHMSRYMGSAPSAITPHVHGEDQKQSVYDIVQAGSKMFYGGYFASASSPSGKAFSCAHLVVQDLRTKAAGCPLRFNGQVNALIASADGRYVYAGGAFTTVTAKGKAYPRVGVTRIDTATMLPTSFDPVLRGGEVLDLKIIGATLVIGGAFTSIQGASRIGLGTVSATTAKLNNYMAYSVRGTFSADVKTKVTRIAVSPKNDRAVIIGNFTHIAGKYHPRAAVLRLASTQTNLSPWYASSLGAQCASSRPAYLRDVDFSPTGNEFVIASTGGQYKYPKVCDAVSMWTANDSTSAMPRWVDYTPNDTILSVVHTGPVVYAAGHEKAHNTILVLNGKVVSKSVAPEVKVSGIGALYASSGKAVPRKTFSAGRDRGIGVEKLYVVPKDAYHPAGMYVGSDTEWWYNVNGARAYKRERIAFLPMQ